jgi:hypothetical protein
MTNKQWFLAVLIFVAGAAAMWWLGSVLPERALIVILVSASVWQCISTSEIRERVDKIQAKLDAANRLL